ncbi:cyclin-D3-1-like isoform X2 [Herrania umbratica]|uniref:Cyclin-D3-1-like isoform X2 n=1 Tax=Herrania umbratica TaxID=108875 RepID=A0A6J1ABF5_9ROSI|nr:cyclin-D3-1-like isoform X2 [Herrania umbratica]
MAPSFDCAVSSLLCAEDNSSIFNDNEYCGWGAEVEEFGAAWNHRYYRNSNQNRVFNGVDEDGLPLQSEECLALMVEKEQQHLPNADYLKRLKGGDLDLEARKEAVDWIWKVHAHFGFGPLCAYLSINYLDRFLSAYELPGKAWMMQLLAVACLSIAAKMEETEVPLILDLQVGESKFVFEARTIQRMELLVLSTLKWRMQAITPFSFLDYFLYKLNDDKIPLRSSILRSIQLISSTIKGIDFLEFKSCEIAAAVAISVAVETKTVDTEKAISVLTQYVQKERVLKCIELVDGLSLFGGSVKGGNASVPSVPQSPIGVLDAACLSYKSDDTTVGSCASSSHTHTSPSTKRRKLSRPCEVEL